MSLHFRVSELLQELEIVRRSSHKFLSNSYVFESLEYGWRQNFKGAQGSSFVWEIPRESALRTKPSFGDYAPGGNGALSVFATLSFKWQMRVVSSGPKAIVEPYDLASTEIMIFKIIPDAEAQCIAKWHFDVADAASPGCHFHLQVAWDEGGQLDVPRVPIPMVLPTDALEFLLGELFQDTWPQYRLTQQENSFQRKRMNQMLAWMHLQLNDAKDAPWLAIKSLKPVRSHGLFNS